MRWLGQLEGVSAGVGGLAAAARDYRRRRKGRGQRESREREIEGKLFYYLTSTHSNASLYPREDCLTPTPNIDKFLIKL